MTIERYETKYGVVFRDVGGCKDDWNNIGTSRYYRKTSGLIRRRKRRVPITMQKPALEALKVAEQRLGHEIVVTGSFRTCELQDALYHSDPPASMKRFAPNTVGVHCQALALDASTEQPDLTTAIRKAMLAQDFHQSRPDEPWHFSYHVSA